MPVTEGMEVKTNTPAIRESPQDQRSSCCFPTMTASCLTCVRSRNCELQSSG